MRRHLLTLAVILTVAPGCDNVEFGEAYVRVVPPPAIADEQTAETAAEEEAGPVNVDRPILLAGVRDGMRATLTVVGEIDGDAVTTFPDPAFPEDNDRLATLTAPGSEWILFSEGVRVGRLVADESTIAGAFCGERAQISGVVELVPSASAAERLLALPAEDAASVEYRRYEQLAHVYEQRIASNTIARESIPAYGAPWPANGVIDVRKHIQSFDVPGARGPYIAATFVYQDELEVAPPGQGAYALFVIGEQVGEAHETAYTWYRAVDTDGKGAPRYFDHLDWDGDGEDEIILDVLGSNRRWFAGLAQQDGTWQRTFQDACGSGSTSAS